MKQIWRRFCRLWRESEIKLDAPGLRPGVIHPGDRLQIGPRLWRVERLRGPACFELASDNDASRYPRPPRWARLWAGKVQPWLLEEAGATTPFSPDDLVHFPVSRHAPRGSYVDPTLTPDSRQR